MRLLPFFKRKQSVASRFVNWEPSQCSSPTYVDTDGRRHRADAPYLLPKDEKEIQRLEYQHYILRQVLQGNTFAPVHDLLRTEGGTVLDVGSGTGRWGMEIAASYPKTHVIGLDLEDVPRTASTPLNYQFYRGNVLHGLPFPSHTFQYVHQRLLVAAIPRDAWSFVLGELKRVTAPYGWIECVEMGNVFHHVGPATKQFLEWWVAISASRGIDASNMAHLGKFLQHAGLSHIKTETRTLAVGSWGGRLGNLLAQDMLAGWPTMRPLAFSVLGVAHETFDAVMAQLEEEWNVYHTSYEVYCACGRRGKA